MDAQRWGGGEKRKGWECKGTITAAPHSLNVRPQRLSRDREGVLWFVCTAGLLLGIAVALLDEAGTQFGQQDRLSISGGAPLGALLDCEGLSTCVWKQYRDV